jgi:hypothetical protein
VELSGDSFAIDTRKAQLNDAWFEKLMQPKRPRTRFDPEVFSGFNE